MSTSIRCRRLNHMNLVLEAFDASVARFQTLYDAQFVADMPQPEWHAGLVAIGRVLFELFVPHEFLLNARYGPPYVGVEYQADMDVVGRVVAERGMRVVRDHGLGYLHTHPADGFGVAFEFFGGNFHDAPQRGWREQMKTAEYWRDEHPLGLLGQKGYSLAVGDVVAASEFLQGFLGATVRYEEPRPAIAARAVGLEVADTIVELLTPSGDGVLQRHLHRFGDGIRSTVFAVRDLARVDRYFGERGVTLQTGDAPDRLAVPEDANLGVLFEFSA